MPYRYIKSIAGRRGAFLMLAGLMFLPVSVSYIFTIVRPDRVEALDWLPEGIRLWQFGILFTLSGLAAMFIGLWSAKLSAKWISYGFVAALVPPLIASAIELVALSIGESSITGLFDVVFYLSLVGMIRLASGWPNPLPIPADPPVTGSIPTLRGGENGTLA